MRKWWGWLVAALVLFVGTASAFQGNAGLVTGMILGGLVLCGGRVYVGRRAVVEQRRMIFTPIDPAETPHPDAASEASRELTALGFAPVGVLRLAPWVPEDRVVLHVFALHDEGVYGVVHDREKDPLYIELMGDFAEKYLVYDNRQTIYAWEISHSDTSQITFRHYPRQSAAHLLECMRASGHRPTGKLMDTSGFEYAFAERERKCSELFPLILASLDWVRWKTSRFLREKHGWTDADWESMKDRVLTVCDLDSRFMLSHRLDQKRGLASAAEIFDGGRADDFPQIRYMYPESWIGEMPPRALARRFIEESPPEKKPVHLATVDSPPEADIYLLSEPLRTPEEYKINPLAEEQFAESEETMRNIWSLVMPTPSNGKE